MKHEITLIKGDGIGPEVADAVLRILDCAGLEVDWDVQIAGETAVQQGLHPLPEATLDSIRRTKVALKGPVTTPIGKGFTSVNVGLRKALNLYANLRPARSLEGIESRYQDVDLVVVRENTESLYSGLEHEVVPGVITSLKVITEVASTRVARFAFEYAVAHGRKRVTAVHKANIMKLSDGLFLSCFQKVAEEYPDIQADDRIIDALCMHLVKDPKQFDVLLLENLYGDIVSDLTAGLVGGLGIVAGANIGIGLSVFEAVHGSAPDIAGQNVANPTALLQSAVLMLRHIGENEMAGRVESAMIDAIAKRDRTTRDIGGDGSTSAFADAVCERLG
ncbi:MAG: isocitrate/isopropylmalate dehydrogenase family protein [Acidobacteria bacterium]|nr:isocitrate/isopropylmalate dehydrogenase family protein [Acidobacteriota bacterium]